MKKTFFIFLLIAVICLSSCNLDLSDHKTITEDQTTSLIHSQKKPDNLVSPHTSNDAGGAEITPRKYRTCYYTVTYPFALLVGIDQYWEWHETYNIENPDDTNEMVIKRFIQHFNISREDFDKANLQFAKIRSEGVDDYPVMNPKDYADQEPDEIYNTDIIYSFDDNIINNYYLAPDYAFGWRIEYEQAVADGTYQTRTTDWVDIEQMEADIIAKYGETEIVTETAIPENDYESTTLISSETEE